MSNRTTKERNRCGRNYKIPANRPCVFANLDGHMARDIVEAALTLHTVKRLDQALHAEARQKAKVAAVSLAKMPWE